MKSKKRHSRAVFSVGIIVVATVFGLLGVSGIRNGIRSAFSLNPIREYLPFCDPDVGNPGCSGGGGSSATDPSIKLYLYQGVVMIEPSATQIMELGANGTTVRTTGAIKLRPGGGGAVAFGPPGVVNKGGEFALMAPSGTGFAEWHVQQFIAGGSISQLRFFTTSNLRFYVTATGETHINGRLCLDQSTGTQCIADWSSVGGGADNLQTVLEQGNGTTQSIVLGQGTTPGTAAGYIDASTLGASYAAYPRLNTVSGISTVEDSLGAAGIVSINSNWANAEDFAAPQVFGYAAYFSGRVGIFQQGVGDPGFASATELRLAGSYPYKKPYGTSGTLLPASVLSVDNRSKMPDLSADPNGYGARFSGSVEISGGGTGAVVDTDPEATLKINTIGPYSTVDVMGPSNSGMAVYGVASPADGAGNITVGIQGTSIANWTLGGGTSASYGYAGYFMGQGNVVEGLLNIRPYATQPWGLLIGSRWGSKQAPELQVCDTPRSFPNPPVPADGQHCYGKYVATIGKGVRGGDRATTQLCYESAGTITCANMYATGSGCVGTGVGGLKTASSSAGLTSVFNYQASDTPAGLYCRGAELGAPYREYTNGSAPYRASPTAQLFCVSGATVYVTPTYYQSSASGGCKSLSPVSQPLHLVSLPTTEYIQVLEIR